MKRNIRSYAKLYKGVISEDICKDTVRDLAQAQWMTESYFDAFSNMVVPIDHGVETSLEHLQTTDIIMQSLYTAISKYVLDDFQLPWYPGWNGFSNIKFNRYGENVGLPLRCEHATYLFDGHRKGIPVLTVLGFLNNDYEGGELNIWDNEIMHTQIGDVLIMPSNFMFPYCIMPVTKGVKYDFISYVW